MSTIAAIATPQAAAGIGIIRISGEDAIKIADAVFTGVSGKPLSEKKGYEASFGHIHDGATVIDEAVALVFRAPKSYTGENTVEFSCHGGMYILSRALRAVLNAGAAAAEPGEFTKRAFLNEKMDLSEAESVMSLISSFGEEARAATLNVLGGSLNREISECRDLLARTSAFLAAWVDYPDDEIPEISPDELLATISGVKTRLEKLLDSFDSGRAVLEGIDTAIVGRPNVGKSTLLNALTGCNRAIVTDIAGTTRDVLEETVRLGNVTLRLADTAGIRSETGDAIEKIGVELAKERLNRAGLVLIVLDSANALTDDDITLLKMCAGKRSVTVVNKTDLGIKADIEKIKELSENVVMISAKENTGTDELKSCVEKIAGTLNFNPSAPLLISERQRVCVKNAVLSLDEAQNGIKSGITPDAVNVCTDCAIEQLSVLTGEKATETVVNEVFKNFCVGK